MTSQQSQAYPLVYRMKLVSPVEYPDISQVETTFLDSDSAVTVVDNFNMFAVMNTESSLTSSGRIVHLEREEYHEHYFVKTDVDIRSGAGFYEPYTASGAIYPPKTKIKYINDKIYVMSLSNAGDGSGNLSLEQFTVANGLYDLSLDWRQSQLGDHITYFQPERYDNHDLFGMTSTSGDTHIYTYYYDFSLTSTGADQYQNITIHKFSISSGIFDSSMKIDGIYTGANNFVNGIIIDKPSPDHADIAVTVNTTAVGIQLGHIDMSGCDQDISIGPTEYITTNRSTMPITRTYWNSTELVNTFMTYVDLTSTLNRISIADSTTEAPATSTNEYFTLPYVYSIDKTSRFSEAYNSAKDSYAFSLASNPMNPNFFYIGYITGAGQIRVIKMYRYKPSGQSNHEYLLMWATVADGTTSAFMDVSGDFTIDSSASTPNCLSLVTDKCGDVYVFCRKGVDGSGLLRMWKIREYELDFGQDAIGINVSSDPTVFPDFLSEITDNYSVWSGESSIFLGGYPDLNDVIISNVQKIDNNFHITFKYIDYNIFQSLNILSSGQTIAQSFNTDLLTVLTAIYGSDNTVSVLNLNVDNFTIYEGTENTMTVIIPANTLIKPCVVRGTEVLAWNTGSESVYVTTIEKLSVNDYVMNQDAKPVKIVHHTKDTISTNDWTTPYVIPVNYFGKQQPYAPLLISGDHGIRMEHQSGKVVRLYPYTIKCGLKRIPVDTIVEYHHLRLENQDDFFIANGVLVESIRDIEK